MIQLFGKFRRAGASRRGTAVLVAIWLNLALLPCAMAMEVPDEGHDCCPPTIELQSSDCCELGDVTLDGRDGSVDTPDDLGFAAIEKPWLSLNTLTTPRWSEKPPDPGYHSPPLHKLFCVYLK
jgi:hypothetical protein